MPPGVAVHGDTQTPQDPTLSVGVLTRASGSRGFLRAVATSPNHVQGSRQVSRTLFLISNCMKSIMINKTLPNNSVTGYLCLEETRSDFIKPAVSSL